MADEVIYAGGDVVLVTGPDETPQRFRVSSIILSCASPVFRTMFGSTFAEGQELASSGTITKRLEDDDTKAIRIVLNCLHYQFKAIPKIGDTKTILKVAIIADKYDCSRALSSILTEWCDRFKNSHFWDGAEIHIPEWVDILAATYLNGLHELFGTATERLIFSYAGNFHHLAKDHRAWIPDYVLLCLDVARQHMRAQYRKFISKIILFRCSNAEFHNAIEYTKTSLDVNEEWAEDWSVLGLMECRREFLAQCSTSHIDQNLCKDCGQVAVPYALLTDPTLAVVEVQSHELCLYCCTAADRDPYRCLGNCHKECDETDEEEEAKENEATAE